MPLKVDPNKGGSGVGKTFTVITIALSIGLNAVVVMTWLFYGTQNGFTKFF